MSDKIEETNNNQSKQELKRKRVKDETDVKVKKERGSGEAKCEVLMQSIIDSDDYSDFVKDQCNRRINQHKTYSSKFFQSIKNDLNEMIKNEKIFIQTHTCIMNQNCHNRDQKIVLQFHVTGKNEGNKGNKIQVSKFLENDQDEEKQQPWFENINRILIHECEALNNIERKEIIKLVDKCQLFLNKKQHKITKNQLTQADIVNNTVVNEVLQMQYEEKNPQIIEQIDRRLDYQFKPNQLYQDIIFELDQMIEKKDTAIPLMFNVTLDAKTNTYQLAYQRKNMNKNITKLTTIKFTDIDKFECFRACNLIFDWYKKIAGEQFIDKQIDEICNKIELINEIINND